MDLLYPLVSSAERIDEYDVKDMLEAIKVCMHTHGLYVIVIVYVSVELLRRTASGRGIMRCTSAAL